MLFILGGRHSNPTRAKHMLKRAESHRCEVNTLWKFAGNFSIFSKGIACFSKGNFFKKSLRESKRSDRF